jgi:hypothetical protein
MTLTQTEAFVLTLLIEGAAAYLLAPRFSVNSWRAATAAVIGSTISHPVLWPSALALFPQLGPLTVPILEFLVVLFESVAYRLIATRSWRTALILSAIVNFLSWLAGFLLQGLR